MLWAAAFELRQLSGHLLDGGGEAPFGQATGGSRRRRGGGGQRRPLVRVVMQEDRAFGAGRQPILAVEVLADRPGAAAGARGRVGPADGASAQRPPSGTTAFDRL